MSDYLLMNGEYMNKTRNAEKGHIAVHILLYALCVLLVVFYLLVFWWGKHPQVGMEYRMYYLTHELSDWPGYGNLSYEYGTKEYCTKLKDRQGRPVDYKVCQRKGKGWKEEQYDGSVNDGKESSVYYRMNSEKQAPVLACNIKTFSGEGKVSVYAGDKQIGTFDNTGDYEYQMDKVEQNELLTIRFVAEDCTFTLWSIEIN